MAPQWARRPLAVQVTPAGGGKQEEIIHQWQVPVQVELEASHVVVAVPVQVAVAVAQHRWRQWRRRVWR